MCGVSISFPELRSPWPAVGKRELWEHPSQVCAIDTIDADCAVKPDMQNSVISIVIWKWMLPELSFCDCWSRGTKLWERDWMHSRQQNGERRCLFHFVWRMRRQNAHVLLSADRRIVNRWPVTGLPIGSRAQVTLFLWGRRKKYSQRQNFGVNQSLARSWLFSDMSFVQSTLGKSVIYCARNLYNLGG